jgi:CheY-like chemotaxis protein
MLNPRLNGSTATNASGDVLEPPMMTVLVVDDDTDVRHVVAEFLESCGFRVLTAAGGADALDMLADGARVGVLVSDVRMPDMSGIELAERAKQVQPALRIVLTSGYFLPQPVHHRFLRKPFRLKELEEAVREAMR